MTAISGPEMASSQAGSADPEDRSPPAPVAAGSGSDRGASVPAGVSGTGADTVIGTITATVRYFAAARAAAGVTEELLAIRLSDAGGPCTVGDILDAAVERHGASLKRVLHRCSFLLDEVAVHGRDTPVATGQTVDVLPPFAGG